MGILLFEFCKRRNARLVFTTVETSFWHLSLPFRKLLAQEILSRQLSTPLALDSRPLLRHTTLIFPLHFYPGKTYSMVTAPGRFPSQYR
jgi:hypothetical protein